MERPWGSTARGAAPVATCSQLDRSALVLHYNGSSWSSLTSGAASANLSSVWGSSGSDVFAVGDGGTILHYNGTSWSPMTSGTSENLYRVWGSSGSDVFAVGGSGTILHYNGGSVEPHDQWNNRVALRRVGQLGWRCVRSWTGRHDSSLQRHVLELDAQRGDREFSGHLGQTREAMWSPSAISARSFITTGRRGAPCPAGPPRTFTGSGEAQRAMCSRPTSRTSSFTTTAHRGAPS